MTPRFAIRLQGGTLRTIFDVRFSTFGLER